jgi:hypothetical protein
LVSECNASAIDSAQHSIAIERQFMEPFITGWRLSYQSGELWWDERRYFGFSRSRRVPQLPLIHDAYVRQEGSAA